MIVRNQRKNNRFYFSLAHGVFIIANTSIVDIIYENMAETGMAWYHYIWLESVMEHIAEHDLTPDDFEYVFENYHSEGVSRSTGRPMRLGETADGRDMAVVFEWVEKDVSVMPVTAYEVGA